MSTPSPRRAAAIAIAIAIATVLAVLPATAAAEEPLHVPWSELSPGLAQGYDPTSSDLCRSGDPRCVDAVIREMERRLRPLAKACDHDAVFALTYLRTTEKYRQVASNPDFFTDTRFVNHQVAVFADYYFRAYDEWHGGDRSLVPTAWAIAFDAADRGRVSGSGNLLLGMSAHVNHDLAFALADIGLVKPDGTTRKVDHDRVNRFLQQLVEPLVAEAAARFDPTMDDSSISLTTLDETLSFQSLAGWREEAWRNAELLVGAPSPELAAATADVVATTSSEKAVLLAESTRYRWPLSSPALRDAHCAANG